MYADLHIHSYYSDSSLSPAQIIAHAKANNVSVIAVSDHNVLEGAREALPLAAEAGLHCISAVELDAEFENVNYHILGYGVDLNDPLFIERVQSNRQRLELVNIKLLEKMLTDYPSLSMDEYKCFDYDRALGGWKLLHYFISKGLSSAPQEGLKYYARYQHNYTCVGFPPVSEICRWIHEAGGKAVLAHPQDVIKAPNLDTLRATILRVVGGGIDGIECYYHSHTPEITQLCLEICEEKGLLVSSGADCHGSFGDETIGQLQTKASDLSLLKHIESIK